MIVAKSVVPRLGTSALRSVCCSAGNSVLLRGSYGGYQRTMATVNSDTANHARATQSPAPPPQVQDSRPASIPSSQQPIEKRVKKEGTEHTTVVREYTWEGPSYTADDAESVQIAHRRPSSLSDYVALGFVTMLRWSFDKATGYKHSQKVAKGVISPKSDEAMEELVTMTPDMWMRRIIFLESVAGVPGFVAGIVRHLSSLRKLEREGGWIGTLLQESENERMHLMTFLQMDKPRPFMRLMIFGAQGVFFNAFFFSYLISPRTCHRFVGFLEEEAVMTYTRCLADIDAGNLDEWNTTAKIPEIAQEYWHLPKDAKLRDLILAVRADESTHRHVNHTFANLERRDRNPFAVADQGKHNPGRGVGMEREECDL